MILPILTRNTQVALQAVPKSYREAAIGIGATKWYMIRTVLLPSSIPGILTGIILSMGRIVAESAALLFTAGSVSIFPRNVFSHLFSSGATLTIQLYSNLQSYILKCMSMNSENSLHLSVISIPINPRSYISPFHMFSSLICSNNIAQTQHTPFQHIA